MSGRLGLNLLSVAIGLLIWAGFSAGDLVGLPGPVEVAVRGWESVRSGQLEADALASLARVLTGFVLGATIAIPVGFLMGWYGIARGLIEPYVQFFRMIPPLAVIPLAIVTMGIGEVPKIFVIFLAAFLSSVVAVYGGVISVDRTLINAARVLGAKDATIFARVIIPASVPFIMVGLRIGLGSSWATVVAAELIAAQSGLGFRMQQAQLYYDLPILFVCLITIGVAGARDGPGAPSRRAAADRVAGAGMTPKISFQDVSARFGDFAALDHFDLDIADGEFITVVGPSGCGKSTAMNIAAGLLKPSTGRVLVDDATVDGPGPERGIIFQQYALFPWLTVRQNVEFGLRIAGKGKAERRSIGDHFMDLVGLADFADALPKTLSGGMKQRCAIARAYAVNPKILLMDEPFGALDALTRVGLQDRLLEAWGQERRTVMFITHDVDEAVYLAKRVVVMAARPGRLDRIIPVDLPYPRTEDIRLSAEFTAIRNQVWRAVYRRSDEA